MQYKPLDKTKNEIRVLSFLDPFRPISAEDSIECTLENVPLEDGSFYSQLDQSCTPTQKYPIVWDRFTKCVDLRDATLEKLTLRKALYVGSNQAHNQPASSRFAWGDFEALSYTWGDLNDEKSIIVNGMHKNVRKNLEAAMRALRDLPETRLGMRYWVDSLCINQEDERERNEQVKRMRDIYGRARAIIVWLGEDGDNDGIAVRTMRHLCWNPCLENPLQLPVDLLLDGWPALFAFAQKPYWNRAWIIQELAMNHNSTLILCGKHKLTRRMLRLGALYIQTFLQASEDQSYESSQDLDLDPAAWYKADRMRRLVNLTFNPNFEGTLSPLLGLVRQADATNKRDKVYSILGLLDPVISVDIVPDYSLSVQQVYTEFMISVIKNTGNLDEIVYGGIPDLEGWSSWVPDWRLPFDRNHTQYLGSRQINKTSTPQIRFRDKGDKGSLLVCSGVQVDTVDSMTAEPSTPCLPTKPRHALDRYSGQTSKALQQTLLMHHPGATEEVLLEIPWEEEYGQTTKWHELSQSSYFRKFHEFRECNKDFRIGGKTLRSFFPRYAGKAVNIETILACLRLTVLSLDRRALITTETGYLGLAPITVCPGDVVTMLFGCKCPVVLRPCRGNMYRVVGECYIHELMDGEILTQERDGQVSRREFVLC